MEEFFLTHRKR